MKKQRTTTVIAASFQGSAGQHNGQLRTRREPALQYLYGGDPEMYRMLCRSSACCHANKSLDPASYRGIRCGRVQQIKGCLDRGF